MLALFDDEDTQFSSRDFPFMTPVSFLGFFNTFFSDCGTSFSESDNFLFLLLIIFDQLKFTEVFVFSFLSITLQDLILTSGLKSVMLFFFYKVEN